MNVIQISPCESNLTKILTSIVYESKHFKNNSVIVLEDTPRLFRLQMHRDNRYAIWNQMNLYNTESVIYLMYFHHGDDLWAMTWAKWAGSMVFTLANFDRGFKFKMNKPRVHHKWIIGYFNEEHKYSVIPIDWISTVTLNGTLGHMCKWLSKQKVTTMMLKGDKPSEDWKSYPVKVIEQFDSYEQAAMKEVQIFRSVSENEEILRQGKRLNLSKPQYDASRHLFYFSDTRYCTQGHDRYLTLLKYCKIKSQTFQSKKKFIAVINDKLSVTTRHQLSERPVRRLNRPTLKHKALLVALVRIDRSTPPHHTNRYANTRRTTYVLFHDWFTPFTVCTCSAIHGRRRRLVRVLPPPPLPSTKGCSCPLPAVVDVQYNNNNISIRRANEPQRQQ
ncbi:hypothetical protein QTP88_028819 [Uroleucon formosanum]